MWMQYDSGSYPNAGSLSDGRVNWQEAIDWCETLTMAEHGDWRLPNAKALQSIVDYNRTPDPT